MKRIYLIALITVVGNSVFAQEYMDTTRTNGNSEDVFLKLQSRNKTSVDRDNWDIAFENLGTTASVLINGQKGVRLFTTPYPVSEWTDFDTTGMAAWPEYINSSESWSSGAFNQQLDPGNAFDLGWGKYNVQTHVITGDSIFLLQLADMSYKKIYVNDLTAGTYTFTYSNVDGSNELKKTVTKNDMKSQNFGYYSIVDGAVVTREPATEDWDLLYAEYIIPIPVGGGKFQNYPVTGIKINKGIQVAQRDGIVVTSDDTVSLTWNTNISEIGSDWKSWNGNMYVYAPDRTYFVRLKGGAVWKIYFTRYEGGAQGTFYSAIKRIAGGVGVNDVQMSPISMYPNPSANQNVVISLENTAQLKQVTVYNASMASVVSQQEAVINTANFTPGLYFVAIETNQGSAVKKLIIQ